MNKKYLKLKLGGRVRFWRKECGINQETLSKRVGITQGALAHIELGKRTPQMSTFIRISKALNISPSVLFTEYDEDLPSMSDWLEDMTSQVNILKETLEYAQEQLRRGK